MWSGREKHFLVSTFASFVSEYSRLSCNAGHVTYGVDKRMLMLPIQIHHVSPKSYLLGGLVEIKSKAASFLTKNRNVDLFFFVHSK